MNGINCFVHSDDKLAEYRLTCQVEYQSCVEMIFCHDYSMFPAQDPQLFERMFIAVVSEIIDNSQGLNHSVFARAVWGDDPKEVSKWRRIRNKSKEGKPQKLLLSDAVKMTQVLQTDFASFAWKVAKHIEVGQKKPYNNSLPERTKLLPGKTG